VVGCYRFLWRVWRLVSENLERFTPDWPEYLSDEGSDPQRALRRKTHQTILKVSDDFERMHFNTAVAATMELANDLGSFVESTDAQDAADRAAFSEGVQKLLALLSPIVPHICDELWDRLGLEPSIFEQPWPEADPSLAAEEQITIVVQVDGKLRDKVQVAAGTDMDAAAEMALESERVHKFLEGREIVNTVKVPDRLINFVTR